MCDVDYAICDKKSEEDYDMEEGDEENNDVANEEKDEYVSDTESSMASEAPLIVTIQQRKKGKKIVYPSRYKPKYKNIKYTRATVEELIAKKMPKNPKNGSIVEKHIYNSAIYSYKKMFNIAPTSTSDEFCRMYADIAFTIINRITSKNVKDIINILKENKTDWTDPVFADIVNKRKAEESVFTGEVEDGIHECRKCGGKKTKSCDMQTRSADEGATVFVFCVTCKNIWKFFN